MDLPTCVLFDTAWENEDYLIWQYDVGNKMFVIILFILIYYKIPIWFGYLNFN